MTTILDINPSVAPVGQWIYITGTDFDLENTQVYFGNTQCEQYVVSDTNTIQALVPIGCDSSCNIRLMINSQECISPTIFNVELITDPPIATSFNVDDTTQWVQIIGENFVYNNTTILFNGNTITASVDASTVCGFRKNVDDVVSSLTIQTPNGSVSIS